jgi:hypothetical protein
MQPRVELKSAFSVEAQDRYCKKFFETIEREYNSEIQFPKSEK